jgi:ribose transport system substrate-binding protein
MGKLKRYSTCAALAAVCGVVATGCGSDEKAAPANGAAAAGQGDQTIRVAFLSSIANTFTQAVHEGFNAAAKGTGVEVKMFDTGTDPQKQYNTFTDIISQKQFDGIAVLPIDAASLVPAVQNAIAADIKVVSFNNPLGPKFDTLEPQVEGQTNVVMDASQFQRGIWMGEMAVDACEGIDPCEVSWLSGLAGIAGEQALVDGFKKGISTAPSVKLATVRAAGGYTPEVGRTAAQNMLQANKELDVIAGSDQLIHGAQLAAENQKVTGKVKLIGLGGSEIALNGIKAGTWYGGVVTLPYDVGVASFEALVEGIKTGKAGTGVNVTDKKGINPKITKENVDSFKPQWKG